AEQGLELARIEALERALEDAARLGGMTGSRQGMHVRRDDLRVVGLLSVGRSKPRERAVRGPERHVEQVPEVVRVPGIAWRRRDRLLIGGRGAAEITEQRLTEGEDGPGAIVVAAMRERTTRIDG